VDDDVDVRVDLAHRVAGRLRLFAADVGLPVDDLALEVRLVDRVELHDAERADARRGQVHQGRRTQPAGAYAQHLGVLEPLLPGHPDLGNDQVAGVAADLIDGQRLGGFDQRWQRHSTILPRPPSRLT
jgi:hypothetical protein